MVDRSTLRLAAVLLVVGELLFISAGLLHPAREPANNHVAVFAEYAADATWTAVHLWQFIGAAILLAGLLALDGALRIEHHGARWLARFGAVSAIVTLALTAVLQAVDGVALKQAVDAWAGAPAPEQVARFASAELVRWLEWATRSYQYLMLGITFILFGTAISWSGAIPKLTGYLAILVGAADIAQSWVLGYEGFSESNTLPNLLGLLLRFVWVLSVAIVALRMREASAKGPPATAPEGSG